MMRTTTMLLGALGVDAATTYPFTYTDCGIDITVTEAPQAVVTMNQGVTEFMLAMGLQDHMVGTAYLDDEIWPRYAAQYNSIEVLAPGYATQEQIMEKGADFLMGNYNSAFGEKRVTDSGSIRGIFDESTVGPCDGVNSDFFPTGTNETLSYSRCRPQLHDAGIATWLERTYCEDTAFRPTVATEDTVYDAVKQLGDIFDVPEVATALNDQIKNDFEVAAQAVKDSGHALTAILLDGLGCDSTSAACDLGADGCKMFVGAGEGSVNLILNASGLTNLFSDKPGSYACVDASEVLDANPDVLVIVEASWDSFLNKIDYLHNNSAFCQKEFVKHADYIAIPFSASALGPRNGAAALDLVSAAIHVTTGGDTLNFQSGVTFADPDELVARTKNLKCPLALKDIRYSSEWAGETPTCGDPVGDFDGDGAFRLADASFTAEVWSGIQFWPWGSRRRLAAPEKALAAPEKKPPAPEKSSGTAYGALVALKKSGLKESEKSSGTTYGMLVGLKMEGQTMQVHAFLLDTDPAHVVGSTAGLRWKTVEVAFSGGTVESAVAHHDGQRALVQGTAAAGVVDLSGSGKTFPPGLAMTVTFSADTNMDDVRIDYNSPVTIVTTGALPTPTMVAPQSQLLGAALA